MYILKEYDGKHVHVTHTEKRYNVRFLAENQEKASEIVCGLNLPAKLEELAAHRYIIETSGIDVNGMRVKTDRESQAQLNGAYSTLKAGFITETPWKADGAWVTVTLETIEPVARAVALHVNQCFTAEEIVENQLRAIADNDELMSTNVVEMFNSLVDVEDTSEEF